MVPVMRKLEKLSQNLFISPIRWIHPYFIHRQKTREYQIVPLLVSSLNISLLPISIGIHREKTSLPKFPHSRESKKKFTMQDYIYIPPLWMNGWEANPLTLSRDVALKDFLMGLILIPMSLFRLILPLITGGPIDS